MDEDPMVAEVRKIRDDYARGFGVIKGRFTRPVHQGRPSTPKRDADPKGG